MRVGALGIVFVAVPAITNSTFGLSDVFLLGLAVMLITLALVNHRRWSRMLPLSP